MARLVARNAKLNKFNLSHDHKTTMDMGFLVPVACIPTLPGDWFKMSTEFLLRFMPTVSPVMHRFRATLRAYYTPYRILMEQGEWYKFLTGGEKTGTEGDSVVLPYITSPQGGFAVGSLADHFGIQTGVAGLNVSAFPFRAYALIYNEWYKNQSIQDDVALSLADGSNGADVTTNTNMLRRSWQRDYFTDCMPSPQKGPGVLMPMGDSAPLVASIKSVESDTIDPQKLIRTRLYDANGNALNIPNGAALGVGATGYPFAGNGTAGTGFADANIGLELNEGAYADLSNATAPTMNQLRLASTIQQFQELNQIGGSRPVEWVYNHYGVRVPDATLQRPLLLGGFSSSVVISEVLQTSSSTATSPQGSMAGHGVGAGSSPVINFHCTEHGLIIFLLSVMPESGYFQGVPREFSKTTRYEFGIPLLAHIGEQGVKNRELYAQGTNDDDKVFGYQPNYQEYRQIPSQCTGQMRTTLAFWHEDRKFNSLPQLNSEFVECNPDTRIWAVEGQENDDHLIVQMLHHIVALRPLPKYGTPGIHIM